ncbi:MAG: SMI1/KNR4 family protein [Candidatus Melainabacteria bacterium]|nr:SMI1/KNR4 family protein [Candidatus Melainabacteria bacterium]
MTADFAEFLTEHASKKVGNKPLFVPGLYDESAKYAWIPWKGPSAVRDSEIATAEERLRCTFPAGYRTFVQTVGPGMWADAGIAHPKTLYAFDEDLGSMSGFIALAYNVDGCGNSIAFNGRDSSNQQVYFCNHDPFGYAVAAASFEEWMQSVTHQKLSAPNKMRTFYTSMAPFRHVK